MPYDGTGTRCTQALRPEMSVIILDDIYVLFDLTGLKIKRKTYRINSDVVTAELIKAKKRLFTWCYFSRTFINHFQGRTRRGGRLGRAPPPPADKCPK